MDQCVLLCFLCLYSSHTEPVSAGGFPLHCCFMLAQYEGLQQRHRQCRRLPTVALRSFIRSEGCLSRLDAIC
uniref:Secreted protein n=1 Tax=Fundulus heteroclitus TaxID=8078 RepID=A0A3Q2P2A7_FUNHE